MQIGIAGKRRRVSLREQRRRRERRWLIAAGAVAIVLIAAFAYALSRPEPGTAVPDLGNAHIDPPQRAAYNSRPPTSGPHYTASASWGMHEAPIANELQVHNLEDGGVLVQYNCPDGCPDLVAQLTEVVERYDEQVILAPYPDMDAAIALTAWGRIDTLDGFDEERIVDFVRAYRGINNHR